MAQTKDNTAYKVQILDEYNNPYSPITSIYSLYYIDNTENNNIRKKPTVLSKINITDGKINSNSILDNYRLLTQNGIKDTETSGINGDSVLHEYTVQSVSLTDLLNTSQATDIIAPNVNQWISQNNITYFKLKNLGIDASLPATLDDVSKGFFAGGQDSNKESVLYYKSDTGNKSWKLEIPSSPNSNNHIKLSGQNNISKKIAWTDESIYTTYAPLEISKINPQTGQPENAIKLNYLDPFEIKSGNKLSLKIDPSTMAIVDHSLKCIIQPGNNGTTYEPGVGIAINSDRKISVKLASSNSRLTFDPSGGLKCIATGGTTYTPGNGIDISNEVIKAKANQNGGIKVDNDGISCKTLETSGTAIDSSGNVIINQNWFTIDTSQLVIGKASYINGIVSNKPISATAFYSTSDIRKKMDIKPIENDDNIPEIVEFKWKSTGKKSYGFIAQDLQEDYPELINDTNPELLHMDYMATLSLVIGKLQAKIKKLEQRIIELENKETV